MANPDPQNRPKPQQPKQGETPAKPAIPKLPASPDLADTDPERRGKGPANVPDGARKPVPQVG